MRRSAIVFILSLFIGSTAYASGFSVQNQSSRAMGMGNAFTALADDAAAAWYNPAGLAFQDGGSVSIGGQFIMPKTDFTPAAGGATYRMDKKDHLVPYLYAGYGGDLPVTLGLAVNAPFGLSTDWTNSGAPFDLTGQVTFSEIKMVNINPMLAYRINEQFAVAIGVTYYNISSVAFDNNVLIQHGSGDGFGGNAALLYKGEHFNAGISYHSRVKVDVAGTATAIGVLAPFGSTSVTSSVTLPDVLKVGIAFYPAGNLMVSAQANWLNWKTFDQLNFNRGRVLGIIPATSSVQENWKAVTSLHLGMEWSYHDKMKARFGYSFDPSPVSNSYFSPRTPINDQHMIAIGYGYSIGQATIDLAYGYLLVNNRNVVGAPDATRDGSYKSRLHLASATLSYHF